MFTSAQIDVLIVLLCVSSDLCAFNVHTCAHGDGLFSNLLLSSIIRCYSIIVTIKDTFIQKQCLTKLLLICFKRPVH